jgi:ubiquitin-activating enzyme E1
MGSTSTTNVTQPSRDFASAHQIDESGEVDETQYSRQLYTFGKKAMEKMLKSSVLILGVTTGCGMETAKSGILSGFRSVTLYDNTKKEDCVTEESLGELFMCTEQDVGKPLMDTVVYRLSSLNTSVNVNSTNSELTPEFLKNFTVVVSCNGSMYDNVKLNNMVRDAGVSFVMANCHGYYGYIFSDFGPEFTVVDSNGEKLRKGAVIGTENLTVGEDTFDNVIVTDSENNQ